MIMDVHKITEVVKNATYFSGVIQIIEHGTISLNVAAGYAKRDDELPNTLDTAFGIASGTKGFTALGILRLVDQGKLSLEDRVFDILPYAFPNMDTRITVRHLLSNTSGIYDYFNERLIDDFGPVFEKLPMHKILSITDMLPLLVDGDAYFQPGEKFTYCNSGFVILGLLIEVVSGMEYADYIQQDVCEPLGLTRTGCYKSNQLPKNCAYGYIQDDNGAWYSNIFEIPIVCTADGGLFTTADDMAKMWHGLLSGNFLCDELLAEVLSIQATVTGDWCKNLHYGLGFWIQHNPEGQVSAYYLVGGDPGVSFSSTYTVEDDRVVTILGNTSDGADRLREEISIYLN